MSQQIQELQVQHFYKADPAYGTGVAKGLRLNIESIIAKKDTRRPPTEPSQPVTKGAGS